ncbi:unnamed protein product [Paramecium primaurelia]|uniref:Protein kinase domain-containing protein n=1 Tax=Paramecium primaurelia TaxID=5886 RepID=A0A8S1KVH1_PARPR|nr:unnamed protein product [Paramecium primaurelia]
MKGEATQPKTQTQGSAIKNDKPLKQVKQSSPIKHQIEPEVVWPFFAPQPALVNQTRFWDRKNCKNVYPNKEDLRFQAIMLRVGKKKKLTKGYFFKLSKDGTLSYYKKESDKVAKGYLQITMDYVAHLLEQKSKKDSLLIVQIEKYQGLSISIFDGKIQLTLEFFNHLKDYCIVSGMDKLYTQMELLGKGSFASVYKVKNLSNEQMFAAKTYFKETFEQSQHKSKFVLMIKNEIMVLRKVIHPGIIRLYDVIQEKEKLILIMELVSDGDLYNLIKEKKKIPEKYAAIMLKGVCEALHEMHINEFVHRDLKLENIMMKSRDQYIIKLVDFGFAEPINHKELVSKAGTPGYIPPEIFKLFPYTDKGDVFSVGVIFYSLISGISCFKGKNYQAVLEDNRKCEISFMRSVWNDISSECKHLLKKMLARKPADRYTCADVLKNEWILVHTSNEYEQQADSELERRNSYQTMKKSHYSHYNSVDGSQPDFNNDFSYHTNDLKSFYHRNSQKTVKTQRSIMSIKSNNDKMKQSMRNKSANSKQQQFTNFKSQTLKNRNKSAIHSNTGGEGGADQKSVRWVDKKNKSDEPSFGDKKENDSIKTSISLKIFEDFEAINQNNVAFLKISPMLFNLQKKPDSDAKINEAIRKKKQQAIHFMKVK